MNKAVILAGGKGTRLYPTTKTIPKSLLKIGDKSVIEHQILLLKEYGIKEIWILSGFLGEIIKEYLGDGQRLGVNIYYRQEKTPLGTAGCLKILESEMKEDFLVFSGDVMMDFDIRRFIDWHKEKNKSIVSILVHPNDHPFDSDLVDVDKDDRIISLLRRPHPPESIFLWLPVL